jgi:hypothetical protein
MLACRFQAEGLVVWLDRITVFFPRRKSALKKSDPGQPCLTSATQNGSAGLLV